MTDKITAYDWLLAVDEHVDDTDVIPPAPIEALADHARACDGLDELSTLALLDEIAALRRDVAGALGAYGRAESQWRDLLARVKEAHTDAMRRAQCDDSGECRADGEGLALRRVMEWMF